MESMRLIIICGLILIINSVFGSDRLLSRPDRSIRGHFRYNTDSNDIRHDRTILQHELRLEVYPANQVHVDQGREAVLRCRVLGDPNARISWAKVGGQLPRTASSDRDGYLIIKSVDPNDQGTYVCTATTSQSKEAAVELFVDRGQTPEFRESGLSRGYQCGSDESTCQNGECVRKENVCDGRYDCRDRSDEMYCNRQDQRVESGRCEPNEFRCNNRRCVQKMWVCDSEDDCGDRSDEQNCGVKQPGEACSPQEFKCQAREQCIPRSYHCDGQNDCQDGSDEVGCVPPTVVEPPVRQLEVCFGETAVLNCRATGVPIPHISWRLNWRPVCDPPRCTQTSINGFGTLTISGVTERDQGAYSCEAINVKGRVLATPDAIMTVKDCRPVPQTRCHEAGTATQDRGRCICKTYASGLDCGQCGEYSFYLAPGNPQGCIRCFCMGITRNCHSSNYFRTQERVVFSYDDQGVSISDIREQNVDQTQADLSSVRGYLSIEPGDRQGQTLYWKMPSRLGGNKLTAYGGKLKFFFQYSGRGQPVNDPLVVLKGNEITLIYQGPRSFQPDRPNEILIDMYETSWNREDGQEVTREHFLMTLAGVDSFLIRATHVQGQSKSSLGEVILDIAVPTDTQQIQAFAVEQCLCPEGYQGLSCEECAPGYERSGGGLYLGTCVKTVERDTGRCSAIGSVSQQPDASGRCTCKEYVTGPTCSQCKANSFYLTADHPSGCIPCFCSGVTKDCDSSNFFRSQERLAVDQNHDMILRTGESSAYFTSRSRPTVDGNRHLSVQDLESPDRRALYLELPRQFLGNKITSYGGLLKVGFECSGDGSADHHASIIIRGNDISLHYKPQLEVTPGADNVINAQFYEHNWIREDGLESTREHLLMTLADLHTVLIKATCFERTQSFSLSELSMDYAVPQQVSHDRALSVEQCRCPPGYIGTSCEDCASGYTRTGGGLYLGLCEPCECHGHAETCDPELGQCIDCKHNTYGPKCELCKPPFVGDATRGTPHDCGDSSRPRCTHCQCFNHSPRGCDDNCRCIRCEHNTEGVNCETCKPGFYGDARQGTPYDCKPCPCPGARECYLDHRGEVVCKSCPPGYFGPLCRECAEGYVPDRYDRRQCRPLGPLTVRVDPERQEVEEGSQISFRCTSSDPQARLSWYGPNNQLPPNTYERQGEIYVHNVRREHAGAYRCLAHAPNGQTATGYGTLMIRPSEEPFSVRIAEPKHVRVDQGQPASFRCEVVGRPRERVTLAWSKVGARSLPRDVYESQGTLNVYEARPEHAGQYQCIGSTPSGQSAQDTAALELTPKRDEPFTVRVLDPKNVEVEEGGTATLRCEAFNWHGQRPQLSWSRLDHPSLPQESQERGGTLVLYNVNREDAGTYVCVGRSATGEARDEGTIQVQPKQEPFKVEVKPKKHGAFEGANVTFICEVVQPYTQQYTLTWSRGDDKEPPEGSKQHEGELALYSIKKEHSGKYICKGVSASGEESTDEATLNVKTRDGLAPQPVVTPSTQTVQLGEPVEIMCESSGDPPPIIQWGFKNAASPLRPGIDQDDGRLRIESSRAEDAGDYFCTASNVHGTVSEPATVHVVTGNVKPTVKIVPKNQKVDPGENAEFVCTATGLPEPQITWIEEHKAQLLDNVKDDGKGRLSIVGAQAVNAGPYVCVASSVAGEARDTATLDVNFGDLVISTDPAGDKDGKIVVPHEGPVKIECIAKVARGMPEPKVEWIYDIGPSRGDVPDGYTPMEKHGRFISVDAATEHNEGKYTCRGTSGNITKEVTVEIDVLPRQKRDVIIEGPAVREIAPGESVTLTCKLKNNYVSNEKTDGSKEPMVTEDDLRWIRVSGGSMPEMDAALDDEPPPGVFKIEHFETGMAGEYECQLQHPEDPDVVLGSKRVRLVAEGSHHGSSSTNDAHDAPMVHVNIDGAKVQVFEIGDDAELRCSVAGDAKGVDLKWYYKTKDGTRKALQSSTTPGHLDFDSLQAKHAGLYICVAETDGQEAADAQVELVVSFTERDAIRKRIIPGADVDIECPIYRTSGMTFNWIRLRDTLPEKFTTDGPILKVANFQPEDAGTYECEATLAEANALGYVELIAQDPDVVQLFMEVEPDYVTLDNDVTFRCVVEGDDHANVRWHKGDGELPVRSEIEGNTLTIFGVKKEDTGIYRCEADTKAGRMTTDVVLQIGSKILTNILRRYYRARRRLHHAVLH